MRRRKRRRKLEIGSEPKLPVTARWCEDLEEAEEEDFGSVPVPARLWEENLAGEEEALEIVLGLWEMGKGAGASSSSESGQGGGGGISSSVDSSSSMSS